MMISTDKPSFNLFMNNTNFVEFLSKHFFWLMTNFKKFSLVLFPTFSFPLYFLLLPLIIYGAFKLTKYGLYFLIFVILYLLVLSLSSYALNGVLYPRHFLPALFAVSFLWKPIYEIHKLLLKIELILNLLSFEYFLLPIFVITTSGIIYKDIFGKKYKPFFTLVKNTQIVLPSEKLCMGQLHKIYGAQLSVKLF